MKYSIIAFGEIQATHNFISVFEMASISVLKVILFLLFVSLLFVRSTPLFLGLNFIISTFAPSCLPFHFPLIGFLCFDLVKSLKKVKQI